MGLEDVLGTVSGRDNVVFIALKRGCKGETFVRSLKEKIPDFDVE
jgi:transcriptional regulator of arginine metabolism